MRITFYFFTLSLLLISCKVELKDVSGKIKITTTTTIITDLVQQIGGEKVIVSGLMGAGVDPHLYKASEGDVAKLSNADIIIFGGLHLEGKLVDVLSNMEKHGKISIDLGESLDKSKLLSSKNFGGNYDPHVWFDISLFKDEARCVANALVDYSPENKLYFQENLNKYLLQLDDLEKEVFELISTLPENNRRLVTAHDAFSYFGKAYGFDVVGLQGISTVTEVGVRDVRRVSDYIVEHKIKSIFVESSVPKRTIEALQQAVFAKDHKVEIGGMLYSDALGSLNTPESTYIGMFRYNVKTIVEGLK